MTKSVSWLSDVMKDLFLALVSRDIGQKAEKT